MEYKGEYAHYLKDPDSTIQGAHEQEMEMLLNLQGCPIEKARFTCPEKITYVGVDAQCQRNHSRRKFQVNNFLEESVVLQANGCFGSVFQASHLGTKNVAIKMFRGNFPRDAPWRELDCLRLLKNDYIVEVIGACFMDSPCIVMEQCAGNVMEFREQMTTADKAVVLHDVSQGLNFIHAKDFIHCNIKPEHILLRVCGSAVIGDLGNSMCLNGEPFVQLGKGIGTVRYMNTDALCQNKYSKRTDIWSLGCVIFELDTGDYLFCPESEIIEEAILELQVQHANGFNENGTIISLNERLMKSSFYDLLSVIFTLESTSAEELSKSSLLLNSCMQRKTYEMPAKGLVESPFHRIRQLQMTDMKFANFYYDGEASDFTEYCTNHEVDEHFAHGSHNINLFRKDKEMVKNILGAISNHDYDKVGSYRAKLLELVTTSTSSNVCHQSVQTDSIHESVHQPQKNFTQPAVANDSASNRKRSNSPDDPCPEKVPTQATSMRHIQSLHEIRCANEQSYHIWKEIEKNQDSKKLLGNNISISSFVIANKTGLQKSSYPRVFQTAMFDAHTAKLVGAGDESKVYLVRHKLIGNVALKRYDKGSSCEFIWNEMCILRSLSSPFICNLFGSFFFNRAYFVLEPCLGSLMDFYKFIDDQSKICACAHLLKAIEYIHSKNVVHTDIKPANILMTSSNRFKLTGFGESYQLMETQTNFIADTEIGTLEFQNEDILDACRFSKSSDMWAVGCTVYQITTGESLTMVPGEPVTNESCKLVLSEGYPIFVNGRKTMQPLSTKIQSSYLDVFLKELMFEGGLDAVNAVCRLDFHLKKLNMNIECSSVDYTKTDLSYENLFDGSPVFAKDLEVDMASLPLFKFYSELRVGENELLPSTVSSATQKKSEASLGRFDDFSKAYAEGKLSATDLIKNILQGIDHLAE